MQYCLKLFISGNTSVSNRAVKTLDYLNTNYPDVISSQIVDLTELPGQAEEENILATPTLVKLEPRPPQRFIGDLSDVEKLEKLLGLKS